MAVWAGVADAGVAGTLVQMSTHVSKEIAKSVATHGDITRCGPMCPATLGMWTFKG